MWPVDPYRLHRNEHKKRWKAKFRFFTLVLSNLLIWISFLPNEQKRIKKFSENIKNLSNTTSRAKELIESFKQLKEMLVESEKSVSCDYYDVHDLSKIQIYQHDLSIIHFNISSLASHIHELKLLLSLLNIICIFESRISKHNLPTININIPGYNIEHTPTESKAGGNLMSFSEEVSYKIRSDLNI